MNRYMANIVWAIPEKFTTKTLLEAASWFAHDTNQNEPDSNRRELELLSVIKNRTNVA